MYLNFYLGNEPAASLLVLATNMAAMDIGYVFSILIKEEFIRCISPSRRLTHVEYTELDFRRQI